jgi:hypothetical protein
MSKPLAALAVGGLDLRVRTPAAVRHRYVTCW